MIQDIRGTVTETFTSFEEAQYRAISDVVEFGEDRGARGMGSKDLKGYTFTLVNPRSRVLFNPARNLRYNYCAASLGWNFLKRNDVESISHFNPNGKAISDDGVKFQGADYGKRMLHKVHGKRSPLYEAIELLKHDPDTRRAWVPILNWYYDGGDYSVEGKDVPCTIGFQLSQTLGQLDMQVVMRSQSIIGVLPYDVFLFTVLQELIANELDLDLGMYQHYCLSAHVYDREKELADKMIMDYITGIYKTYDMDQIPFTLSEAPDRLGKLFMDIVYGDKLHSEHGGSQLERMMVMSEGDRIEDILS